MELFFRLIGPRVEKKHMRTFIAEINTLYSCV